MALAWAKAPLVDVVSFLSKVVADQLTEPALRLRPLVLCGPSGVGKSHAARQLLTRFPDDLRMAVSTTTRLPRGKEKDGVDYHFVTPTAFTQAVTAGQFIENDTIHGNMYGMTINEVLRVTGEGYAPVMDMTMNGAAELAAAASQWQNRLGIVPPYVAFIAPPSMEELERRLRTRKTESEEQISRRLLQAEKELTAEFELYQEVFNVVLKKKWTE